MAEAMVIDDSTKKNPGKRKRASIPEQLTAEEREIRTAALRSEIGGLLRYYREGLDERLGVGLSKDSSGSSVIACLLEESDLSLSKLVDDIYQKVKDKETFRDVTVASVKSSVVLIGQRISYGVPNADADVLEDETEEALWCWETRDLKLMPKSVRGAIKSRRMCRKKIHERIVAISEMIAALQKLDDSQTCGHNIRKASEMLGKALTESDIRLLQQRMEQRNDVNRSETEANKQHKELMKQLERSKREAEKEKKKLDRELEKEKKQSEKELRRLQDEAEKEDKRREKEESELKKHIRRQQEELEKEQRCREREEADKKRQLSMQKQASLMERFLKKSKTSSTSQKDQSSLKTTVSNSSSTRSDTITLPVTQLLDHALSRNEDIKAEDIRKSHLIYWRCLGRDIYGNGKQHWGIRKTPKMEVIKELKLSTNKRLGHDELSIEKLNDGWSEIRADGRMGDTNGDNCVLSSQRHFRCKQLLQFDKSHRPAFYGIWPKNSRVVGPRHPFKMDPDLDYDIDSDEEWEEEEPGESLSDCDKDEEEENLEEGNAKVDEEDDSEDGFFVPDGYLSESEGVDVDRKELDIVAEDTVNSPSFKQESESEEISLLFRQQKQLHSWTEHALRKNKPLIIINMMHEKGSILAAEELTGTAKLERTCLQALSMRAFPGFPTIKISACSNPSENQDTFAPNCKEQTPVATTRTITESDLPQIVSVIQMCSQSISKVVDALQQKFPSVPKYLLRNKVREMSEFVDARWQVKKEILDKLGLSISPEKKADRGKSIASFFSKRCLPPGNGKAINVTETSPQSSQKPFTAVEMQPDCTVTQQQPMVSTQSHP